MLLIKSAQRKQLSTNESVIGLSEIKDDNLIIKRVAGRQMGPISSAMQKIPFQSMTVSKLKKSLLVEKRIFHS